MNLDIKLHKEDLPDQHITLSQKATEYLNNTHHDDCRTN